LYEEVTVVEEKKEAPVPSRKDIEELFASINQINEETAKMKGEE
jgi:hypothetical protein